MKHESLGLQINHTHVETYCTGCGNPESSNEHGLGCPASQGGAMKGDRQ